MRLFITLLVFLLSFFDAQSQTLSKPEKLAILFQNQLSVFPQEKIYLHTDKPLYITGEKIWFRAHLVNAENHLPASASRYVYVEMYNPADSLISRIKIRNNNGAYYGHIDIPEDIPEGDYTLRAYTKFMLNLDENYLCTKTIHIGNTKNLPQTEKKLSSKIPATDSDFDVTFYPEGGSLLQGVSCRVAFKALKSNGRPANVEGIVYNQHGNELGKISTSYMGMGSFNIISEGETSCYVVCTDDRQKTKRFELPAALRQGYALSVNSMKEKIVVSVLKSAPYARHDTLYVLAHTRGEVYYSEQWDADKEFITLPKKKLPSGVLHLVLFDANLNPVSERLAFINNDDQARVTYENDQKSFTARSLVNNQIRLTDNAGNPLSGSFSVSVTTDNAVSVDTTANILTYLLLTSDLRGNIENPAAYFTNDKSIELDMLMMTQGWRRYDISAIAQGRLMHPVIPIEYGAEISGLVKGGLFLNKPSKKAKVSIASSGASCFDLLETDSEGRFSYKGCDQPDSTTFIVRVVNKSNTKYVALFVDEETFPKWTFLKFAPAEIKQESFQETFQKYVEQATKDEKYKKSISLPEVIVTARHIPKSVVRASYVVDQKRIRELNDLRWAVNDIPRVHAQGGNVYYSVTATGPGTPIQKLTIDDEINKPLVFEDSFYISQMFGRIKVEEVKNIYFSIIHEGMPLGFGQILRPVTELVIVCKNIYSVFESKTNNIQLIQPLGYQKPIEFYAPKYDTPEARKEETLDMRTTIHWQPDVRTDSLGMAAFEFYTADVESPYTIVIEGITDEGKIIRHRTLNPVRVIAPH